MVHEWNQSNFNEKLEGADRPVLVDMFATWCGPCKMMAPVLEELSNKWESKLLVGKVDIDQSPQLTQKYGIMSVPTLLLFKNGQLVKKIVGMRDLETLEQELEPGL
ncbi:MAG: thioredoxin [Ruminococcus sp.]|jgi:thioredoxin 1